MTAGQARTAEPPLSRVERRRMFGLVLLRALGSAVALLLLYYLAPMENLRKVPVAVSLSVGLVVLIVVIAVQLRAITSSRFPAVQAVQALAVTAPLFLLIFASAYFVLAQDSAANFNTHPLDRTDTLYFTMTTFSTVGFGDIVATSQNARLLVTGQMLLDLVVLGLGVQVYREAVKMGRKRSGSAVGARLEVEDEPDEAGDEPDPAGGISP
jgi:voltage-gated potassium channel